MGIYIYTHKSNKNDFQVQLQSGETVTVGVIQFYCKPYWEAWEAAVKQRDNYDREGNKRPLPGWLDAFDKKLARKYCVKLGWLEKNITPTRYLIYEPDKDSTSKYNAVYEVNGSPSEFYYDSCGKFVGVIKKNSMVVMDGVWCNKCHNYYLPEDCRSLDGLNYCDGEGTCGCYKKKVVQAEKVAV